MKRIFTLALTIFTLTLYHNSHAQLVVTDSVDVNVLVQTLVGTGVIVSNAVIDCPYDAYGTFDGMNSNVGMDNGIILSSGLAADAIGPNDTGSNGQFTQDPDYATWPGDSILDVIVDPFTTNNACILEFDITVGCADTVCFNYSFASEEYLEFVNSNFNDAFGLFVSGVNPLGGTYDQENIAIIPGTTIPVTIDNVNDATNAQFYINNGDGASAPQNTDSTVVQYDGLTVVLPACFAVVPFETYHLKISIADTGDEGYDSGVFLQGQSLSSNTVAVSSSATIQGFDNAVAGCVNGQFDFSITPSADDLVIYLDYQGNAVSGTDYTAGPDSLIIPAGETTAELLIEALDAGIVDGNDTLILIVDVGACGVADTALMIIEDVPDFQVADGGLVCDGECFQLGASGAVSYFWTPTATLSSSTIADPIACPEVTTTYTVTMEVGTCTYSEEVTIEVCTPCPTETWVEISATEACDGETIDLEYIQNDLTTPAIVSWSGPFAIDEINGVGTTVVQNTECVPYEAEYIVTAICAQDTNVVLTDTVIITVYPSDISPFITANESECAVSLSVDPDCTDWISVDDSPTINAGDEGSAELTATYIPSDCASDVSYTLNYDCPLCEISEFSFNILDCDGDSYMVEVDIFGIDVSSEFILSQDDSVIGTYSYADAPIVIGPFPGDGTGYSFSAVDVGDSNCSAGNTLTGQFCYLCDIDNVVLTGTCNSIDDYNLSLSFTGSNVYTISDGTTTWNGISAGSGISLGTYPEGVDVVITITDELADGCEYVADAYNLVCDCDSEPGTIMVNSMNVCPDDLSIVDADDFLLEPGQSVYYLYHNQPTVDGSDLPDLNSDVYTTGSFLTNNGSVIPCGQTVYVTAIGAYEDLAMPGFPDYDDFCLTVSNTIPVNFLCPIAITVDEVCDNTVGEFTYTFMVSGGLPQLISGELYNITGDNFNGTAGLSGSVVVGPIPDLSSYTITAEDANGCTGTITQNVECEKVPIELISFSGKAEEEGNMLSWTTASEIENDYFTILSSRDGINFSAIAQIDGAGNSASEINYDYLDRNASSGISYYRLKQTDFDGSTSESYVITIGRESALQSITEVYPVPADKFIGFSITAEEDSNVIINISDVTGKILSQEDINLSSGMNDIQLDVEALASGIYFISLDSESILSAQKFIKE